MKQRLIFPIDLRKSSLIHLYARSTISVVLAFLWIIFFIVLLSITIDNITSNEATVKAVWSHHVTA